MREAQDLLSVVPYRKSLRLKGRWHLFCAMTLIDDNDTPVQSQPCREAGSRNEGGSERPSEGLETREEVCRLPSDVFLIPGVLRTKRDFFYIIDMCGISRCIFSERMQACECIPCNSHVRNTMESALL